MQEVELQQLRLQQKKNRLIAEETKLKLKMRKMRTRLLIELGGLVVKAGLDHLPTNVFYGALLSLASTLETNPNIKQIWTQQGQAAFDLEQQNKTSVILAFTAQPDAETRNLLRTHGLRFNRFRNEWYGEALELITLKELIKDIPHSLEVINNN